MKGILQLKVFILLLFGSFGFGQLHAQLHKPTWSLLDDRTFSTFDMLTTRLGLAALNDNGSRIILKYENGVFNGVLALNGEATSIIIVDDNVAFVSVFGDGIYQASNKWKDYTKILSHPNIKLLAVRNKNLLATIGGILYYSDDGLSFFQAGGISPGELILAVEILSSSISLAVTGKKMYRSTDGGKNWTAIQNNVDETSSFYYDPVHSSVYAGGNKLFRSLDSGSTWQEITSIFFTLSGPVIGAHDCSGAFYISPLANVHGAMYRSVDQGRFFQEVGPAIFSSTALHKGVVLDRGSTFFWLDNSGLLGVVRDGIDSSITDSVRDHLDVKIDTGVRYSLCNNASPTKFNVSLTYDQCTGIFLDSIKQITPGNTFVAKFTPSSLGDGPAVVIPMSFKATHAGYDSARYRISFHSGITGNIENKFFSVKGLGTTGSPDLAFAPSEINYSPTDLDSIQGQTVTISNPGCDTLIIDTMYSTNPAIFILKPPKFPLFIFPAKLIKQTVTFNPHLSGDYLESIGFESNIGNRFLTLRGVGKPPKVVGSVRTVSQEEIGIFPNPANNILRVRTNQSPGRIFLFDALGRTLRQYEAKTEEIEIDLSDLENGQYVIRIGKINKRFIILR
ncbi:MAG: T9SS type A sorting domain-containing protein [Ignavibacteriota bacterium]